MDGDNLEGRASAIERSHRLTLHYATHAARPHSGSCSCGWRSGPTHAAGIVHGLHNAHLAEVADK